MADDLHASLEPNVVNTGATLEIQFDSNKPWKDASDVIVRIFEIDDASPFEPQPGKGKLVVTFRGSLSDNQFTLTPPPQGKSNPELPVAPGKSPVVKIKIGSTTTDVPLPDKTEEQGVFELRLQVEVVKPKAKKFTNPTKVLVRCFDHFMVNKIARPIVTFITGASTNDPNNDYFGSATKFWKLNADAVIVRPGISIQEILAMLSKEADKYGSWGQINIVAHGRAHSIKIKLFRDAKEGLHTDQAGEDIDRFANATPPVSLPVPDGVDSDTQIVFRACNAGQDQELIDALHAQVFSSLGKLFIPKFTQVYEYTQIGSTVDANEYFEESLSFDTPSTTPPTGADLQTGLEKAWDNLVSPGKGGNRNTEIPTFAEDHDWIQEFPFTQPVREDEMLRADGSPLSDADLITKLRSKWWNNPDKPNNKASVTWKTEANRWSISVKSKTPTDNWPREFFMRLKAGSAIPMFKELAGGGQSIGSKDDKEFWVVKALGVEPWHFNLNFIDPGAGKPLRVEVQDANSGADTFVGKTKLTGGASREFQLPVTITFGQAELEVREAAKPVNILFECKRHFVDRRRRLRTYDATKPYASRNYEKPTVGNPKHYGSSQ